MYIPVQISGRFPDSGIHTGSSLPSYAASDRCCGTIASYSSITVTRSYRICTCFPFTLCLRSYAAGRGTDYFLFNCVCLFGTVSKHFLYYNTDETKRVGLHRKTVRINCHVIWIYYHVCIPQKLCQQPDQYVRLPGLRGSAETFLLPSFSFCKEKRRAQKHFFCLAFLSAKKSGRLNTLGQLFAPLSAEFCKTSFIQCLADFNHQIVVEPQIVHDSQTLSKHFTGL